MDERLAKPPVDPAASAPSRPARRSGTRLWVQIVVSLLVLIAAFSAWMVFLRAPAEPAQAAGQPGAPAGARPGGGGFAGRGGASRVLTVIAAPVTTALINDKLTAIGEGVAARSATLTSATGGTLTEILVKPGDVVKANAPIAQLDAQSQQIAFDRATLAAKDADAALSRATELADAKSIPVTQLNTAQLAADNAALELRTADLALKQRVITAPIDGVVGLIQVSPGNLINAQSVITTIEDSSDILINFWVPERYAGSIISGMAVTVGAVALPGKNFAGLVSAVDNRIDPTSRTLQVQARIPNPDLVMRPGMSFSVTLAFPGENFPSVDPLSVQWSSDGAYVWKLIDSKVHKAIVQIVQRNSGGVLVTGDVKPGDQIITQGILQLQDGAEVKLFDDQGNAVSGGDVPASPAAAPPAAAPATAAAPHKKRGGQPAVTQPATGQGG